jgi:hypothetical protein
MANKKEQISIDAFLRLFLDNKAQNIKINFTFPTQSLDNFFKQTTKHFNEVNNVVDKLSKNFTNINKSLNNIVPKIEAISKIRLRKIDDNLFFLQTLYETLKKFENINVKAIKTNINEINKVISNLINTFTTFGIVNFDDKKLRAKLTLSFNYFRSFLNEFSKVILSDIAKINQQGINADIINYITLIPKIIEVINEALEKISKNKIAINEAVIKLRETFDGLLLLTSFTISPQGLNNMKLIIENFSNFIATLNSIKQIPLGTGAYINYFQKIFEVIKLFRYDILDKFKETISGLKLKTTTDFESFIVAYEGFISNILNFANIFFEVFQKFTTIKKVPSIPVEVFDFFKTFFTKISEIIDIISQSKIKILKQLKIKPQEYSNFKNFLYEILVEFEKTFHIINTYFTQKPLKLKPEAITEYLKTYSTLLQNTQEYFGIIAKTIGELDLKIPTLNPEKIRNFLYVLKTSSSVLLGELSKTLEINLSEITIKLVRLAEVLNEAQGIFRVIINSMNEAFGNLTNINYDNIRRFLYALKYISTDLFTKLSEIKPIDVNLVLNNLNQTNIALQNVREIFKNIIPSINTIFNIEIPELNTEKIKNLLYTLRILSSVLFAKLSEIKPLNADLILNNLNQINTVLVNGKEIFGKIRDNLYAFLNNIPVINENFLKKLQDYRQLIETINEIRKFPSEFFPQSTENSLSYLLRILDVYRDFLVNVKDFNDKFVNLEFNTLKNFNDFLKKVFTPKQLEIFDKIFENLTYYDVQRLLTNFDNEVKRIFGDLSEIILKNSTEFQELFRVSLSENINKSIQQEIITIREDFNRYENELLKAAKQLEPILGKFLTIDVKNLEGFRNTIRTIFLNLNEYLAQLSIEERARLQVIFDDLAKYVKKLEELNDRIKLQISSLEKNKGLDFLNTKLADIDKILQHTSWKLFQLSWSFIYIDIYAQRFVNTLERMGNKILAITKNLNFLFLRMVGINKLITENTIYTENEFKKLIEISVKTPYSLENIIDAYTQLKALGIDNIELLKKIIDTATSFGVEEIKSIADDIARAIQGDTTAFKNLRHSIGLTNITIKELGGKLDSSGRLINRTFSDVKANAEAMIKYLDKFNGSAEKTMGSITQAMTNLKDAINTLFFGGLKSLSGLIDLVNNLSTTILKLSQDESNFFRILSENLGLIALLLITASNILKPFVGLISYLNFAVFMLQNNITSFNSSMLTLQHVENLIKNASSALVNELKMSNKELQAFKDNILTNIRLITNPNFINFSILAQSLSVNMLKLANFLFKYIKEITYGTLIFLGLGYISMVINTYSKNRKKFEAEIKKALQPIKLETEIDVNLAESVFKINDYLKNTNEEIQKIIEKYSVLNVLANKLNTTTEQLVKKLILQNKQLDIKDYLKNINELSGILNLRFNIEGLGTYKSTLNEILNLQTLISKEIDKQANYNEVFISLTKLLIPIISKIFSILKNNIGNIISSLMKDFGKIVSSLIKSLNEKLLLFYIRTSPLIIKISEILNKKISIPQIGIFKNKEFISIITGFKSLGKEFFTGIIEVFKGFQKEFSSLIKDILKIYVFTDKTINNISNKIPKTTTNISKSLNNNILLSIVKFIKDISNFLTKELLLPFILIFKELGKEINSILIAFLRLLRDDLLKPIFNIFRNFGNKIFSFIDSSLKPLKNKITPLISSILKKNTNKILNEVSKSSNDILALTLNNATKTLEKQSPSFLTKVMNFFTKFKFLSKILGNVFSVLINDLIISAFLFFIAPSSLAKQKAVLSSWLLNIAFFIGEGFINIITKISEGFLYTITNLFNKEFWSNLFKNISEGWKKFSIGVDKFLISNAEIIKNLIDKGIGISDDKLKKWQELVSLTKEFTENLKDVSLNEIFNEINKFADKIKSLKLRGYFNFIIDKNTIKENLETIISREGLKITASKLTENLVDFLNKPLGEIINTTAEDFFKKYYGKAKDFSKISQYLKEPIQAILNTYKTAYDAINGVLLNLIIILEKTKDKIQDLSEDIIYNSNIFVKFYDEIFKEFTTKPKNLSQLIISAFNELTNKFDTLVNNYQNTINIINNLIQNYKVSLEQLKNLTASQLKDFITKLPESIKISNAQNLENLTYIIDELTNFSEKFGEKLKDISSEISKYIQNSANLIAIYPEYLDDILNQIETSIEDTLITLYEKYKDNPLLEKVISDNIILIQQKLKEFKQSVDLTTTFTQQKNQLKDFVSNAKNAYELYLQLSKISDKTELLYNIGEKLGIKDFSQYLITTFKKYSFDILDGLTYKTIQSSKAFVELTDKGQEFITEVLNNINKPVEIYSNYINYILSLDEDRLEKLKEIEIIEQQILNDTKLQQFQKEELLKTIKKQKQELLMINKLEEGIKNLIKQTLTEGFDFSILREKFGKIFNDIIQEVNIERMIDNLNKTFENVKSSLITNIKTLYQNTDTLLVNFYRLPQILEKDIKFMLDKYKIKVDEEGMKKIINEVGNDLKQKLLDAIEKSKNIIQNLKDRLKIDEEDELKSQISELSKTLGLGIIEQQNLVSGFQQYEILKKQYQEALSAGDMFLANMLKNQLNYQRKYLENILGGYSYKLEEIEKTAEQMFSDSVVNFGKAVEQFNQAVNNFAVIMSRGIGGGGTTNTNNNQQTNMPTNTPSTNTQPSTYNPFTQGIMIDPASIPYLA